MFCFQVLKKEYNIKPNYWDNANRIAAVSRKVVLNFIITPFPAIVSGIEWQLLISMRLVPERQHLK